MSRKPYIGAPGFQKIFFNVFLFLVVLSFEMIASSRRLMIYDLGGEQKSDTVY